MRPETMQSTNVHQGYTDVAVTTPASANPLEPLDLAQRALRCALRDAKRAQAPDQEVRIALVELCDAARSRGLYAERLIVILKEAWRDLPEARRSAREHELAALERVVTLCIDEYYAPQRQR
jgi:hypothetical protein